MSSPPPLPDWPAQLRAQGRTMTWLASQVGVSRTYLADVASGRKHASPELNERIALALRAVGVPQRLAAVREYADERARWIEVRAAALALAASITAALEDGPR